MTKTLWYENNVNLEGCIYLGLRYTKWVRIALVDRIDLGHFLIATGKVRYPGTLLYCIRVYISGVTKCFSKFLTLSQNFVTHFVTPEIWILTWFWKTY